MTSKTTSKRENRKYKLLMASLIPSLLVTGILVPSIQFAEAAQCSSPHCYAVQRHTSSTLSGEKHNVVVSDLTTSTTCPNSEFIVIPNWVIFSNGDWIEAGAVAGWIQGICRTTEQRYYAFSIGGFYQEFNIGSASIGSTQSFEISDTDRDRAWDVYNNGVNKAHFTMTSSTASTLDAGEETNHNTSSAPKTDVNSIQKFDGSTPSWKYLSSGTNPYQQDTSFGLWIQNCSPNYQHITVGKGGTASC